MNKKELSWQVLTIIILTSSLIKFGQIWLIGSVGASAFKSLNHDCLAVYKVERILDANWFCPEK